MTSRAWALLVFLVTLALYARASFFGWIAEWDDGGIILSNTWLAVSDLRWPFTTAIYGHWVPLTWLTHMAEYRLWGLAPWPYHLVNVLLHATSAALLYLVARRVLGSTRGAVFAALLWAVHPLRIEAVAWVTERRLMLAAVFVLLATLAWVSERRAWALLAYFAAIMSHPMSIMLPWALLALDWYQHGGGHPLGGFTGRWRYAVGRHAPMFLVGAAAAPVAVIAHLNITNALSLEQAGIMDRAWQTAYSLVFYLGNSAVPIRLSHLIEYTFLPGVDQIQYPLALVTCLLLALLCALTWRRCPALTAALLGYLAFALPESGVYPNGPQLVANRHAHLAMIPLALLLAGGVITASRRLPRLVPLTAAGVLAALAVVTTLHLPVWANGAALWTYAAEHEPTCTYCLDLAAFHAHRRGDFQRAVRYTRQAILVSDRTVFPRWERHWNLAAMLYAAGDRRAAGLALHEFIAAVPAASRWTQPEYDRLIGAQKDLAMLEGR